MDDGQKLTLVKLLDHFRRILNELDIRSLPAMAMENLMYEMVQDFHLFWGVKTRTIVQQINYALADMPGDRLVLTRGRTDISLRLERDFIKVGGRSTMLLYDLPLDDKHFNGNPPMRRNYPKQTVEKSTQTEGTFSATPVLALIMDQ